MNAIEFLFTEEGELVNYLVKSETLEQEQRLCPIAEAMLQSVNPHTTVGNSVEV